MSTSFSEALAPLARRLPSPIREIDILRISAQIDGRDFADSAKKARAAVLAWAKRRAGGNLPKEAWEHLDFELLAGGRNSSAVRIQSDKVDFWALRAEDPDKNIAGRVWTTEVVIGGEIGKRPQLSLRLTVSTNETEINIEPHVPGTLLQLISAPGLVRDGRSISDTPTAIRTEDEAEEFCDYLESPERRLPVFVITLPDGEESLPLINGEEVARATAGLAYVAQIPADLTWVLTKRFGKFRSVFEGAIRAYLPGFSSSDDPYHHRLFLAAPLHEATYAKSCETWLRRCAADTSIALSRLGKDVVEFSAVRTAGRRLLASTLEDRNAPAFELLAVAQELIVVLEKQLEEKAKEVGEYIAEIEVSEQRAKAAEQENRSLLFKIRQLSDALAEAGELPVDSPPLPKNWSEFTDWLDRTFPDRVVLTPAARRMVRKPEFEDVAQVARAIAWLATDQHSRRIEGGGTTKDEVIEPGIVNAYCGGDTYQTWWQGRRYDVDQHVKNGGNVRDPRRCLRIYYFWEPDLQQTVIDYLPAHRDTGAT